MHIRRASRKTSHHPVSGIMEALGVMEGTREGYRTMCEGSNETENSQIAKTFKQVRKPSLTWFRMVSE